MERVVFRVLFHCNSLILLYILLIEQVEQSLEGNRSEGRIQCQHISELIHVGINNRKIVFHLFRFAKMGRNYLKQWTNQWNKRWNSAVLDFRYFQHVTALLQPF